MNMNDNDASGYPRNDPAFRKAADKVLQRRQADAEQAERFLRQMQESLRKMNESGD